MEHDGARTEETRDGPGAALGGDAGGRLNLNYDGESAADNEATSVATGQRLLLSQKAKSGRARVLGLQAWSDEGIELTELPRMPPSSKRN